MLIYKCDICEKEFQPFKAMSENGATNVFSSFTHYEMSNVLTEGLPEPKLKVIALMLCSECGEKLNKKVEEIKKEKQELKKQIEKDETK
jgi:DNA-directed RNA polymerase subunit RPC12/RpoP